MASFSQFGNDLYTGKRSFNFVGRRRVWFTIAIVGVLLSIIVPFLRGGFEFGIEFRGGSEFRVEQPQTQADGTIDQGLAVTAVRSVIPRATPRVSIVSNVNSGQSVRVQTDTVSSDESTQIRDALATAYNSPTVNVSLIGATWGADITRQALTALLVFILLAAHTTTVPQFFNFLFIIFPRNIEFCFCSSFSRF